MLAWILTIVAIPLLVPTAYFLIVSGWAWRVPPAAPHGPRDRRFVVVVPAHNEGHVLEPLLVALDEQKYPPDRFGVWVIADRCTDDTAAIADRHANVAAREEGPAGKGAALNWFLMQHPLQIDEALVVLDADNRVPPDLLAAYADELDDGHSVLQAYLDV